MRPAWTHNYITAVKSYITAKEAMEKIVDTLVWGKTKCVLVLYQVGAAIHLDDPLRGNGMLNGDQSLELTKDRFGSQLFRLTLRSCQKLAC